MTGYLLMSVLLLAQAETGPVGLDQKPEVEQKEELQKEELRPSNEFNLIRLFFSGGIATLVVTIPLLIISTVSITFTIERLFSLRPRKTLPKALINKLGQLYDNGYDPAEAYALCQQYPSVLGRILQLVIGEAGRPKRELEEVVQRAQEREAQSLLSWVRPIDLAVSVAPMLGLLGTVLGMMLIFWKVGGGVRGDKAVIFAQGIYTALVTTFVGLLIAIPSAIASHFLTGRIEKIFRGVDSVILGMLPALEQYGFRSKRRR